MIQTLKDTGSSYQISDDWDGAVYDIAVGSDCICGGVGDEFELNYSASSLIITFNAGSQAIIGGNLFRITENHTVELDPNSTIYLTARIDKSQVNGQRGLIFLNTQQGIKKENINGNGNQRDLLLYVITTSASGISSVVDKRYIRTALGSSMLRDTLPSGQTTITFSNSQITTDSALSFYTEKYGVNPTAVSVSNGSVTLTFEAQASNMEVGVKIDG